MASGNAAAVLTVCLAFAILTAVSVYFVRGPEAFALFQSGSPSGGDVSPTGYKNVPLIGPVRLDPDDPTMRFGETRVGHLLYVTASSDRCIRLLFDNRTGLYYDAPEVACGQTTDQAIRADVPDRLDALKKSFQR